MKTKQIIFVVSVMIFACYQIQAQDKPRYKSLESFNNDTIKYLVYNFNTHRAQYEGKTVADVIKNLKLPVIEAVPISIVQINDDNDGERRPIETVGLKLKVSKINSDGDIYIDISFGEHINRDEYAEAITSDNGTKSFKMTAKLYNFLKDKKIESVYVDPIALEQLREKE
jgi:hypothetical protein